MMMPVASGGPSVSAAGKPGSVPTVGERATTVLGIDPGLATTGYGLVREEAGVLALVTYGVITTKAGLSIGERLRKLHTELRGIIDRHTPSTSAVEELFFSANARTAMLVGQARGVVLLTLAMRDMAIHEYTPLQVKQAITGYGGATKAQMQQMVRMLLNLEGIPQPDDAADAIGVAICHLHSAQVASALDRYATDGDR